MWICDHFLGISNLKSRFLVVPPGWGDPGFPVLCSTPGGEYVAENSKQIRPLVPKLSQAAPLTSQTERGLWLQRPEVGRTISRGHPVNNNTNRVRVYSTVQKSNFTWAQPHSLTLLGRCEVPVLPARTGSASCTSVRSMRPQNCLQIEIPSSQSEDMTCQASHEGQKWVNLQSAKSAISMATIAKVTSPKILDIT